MRDKLKSGDCVKKNNERDRRHDPMTQGDMPTSLHQESQIHDGFLLSSSVGYGLRNLLGH